MEVFEVVIALLLGGAALTAVEIAAQGETEVGIGRQQKMIDCRCSAAICDVIDEAAHGGLIRLAKRPRLRLHFIRLAVGKFAALDVTKEDRIVERQFDLIPIEHLEKQNLMPLVLEPSQTIVKHVQVGEQIGNDDDHAARADLIGDAVDNRA